MGKREVRVVIVPKWITAALLILISAAMIALVAALSGRAYATATRSLRELFANALLFVPWGFLAFMLFDRKKRSRSYVVTLIVGIVRENRLDRLLEIEPDFVATAQADSWWQMLVLHGATGGGFDAELLSYEAPTYFGMLCASFTPRAS